MLPVLLAQIGLPLLIRAVGAGLERIDNPIAAGAAKALAEVGTAVGDGRIPTEAVTEANRHVERMAELESGDFQAALTEVNQSLRAEVASDDPYVRRMRPTFGYVMAATWSAIMGAVAYVIVTEPGQAGAVVSAMASLDTIWSVGLGVLGIYVYKRSEEKRRGGDTKTRSPLVTLAQRLTGRAAS
ncbi:MAG TPA: 3TM-type holin [Azospirillaceae bacterium]|nr:3TM-type holin [Azospirillaceae bacterium]